MLSEIALPTPFKRAAGATRAALRRVLDIALPPLCAACREPVAGRGVCASCWSKLSFIARPYCERLGTPFVYDPGPKILSMEAIADPPSYHRARATMRFDKISRALVNLLKCGDRLDLTPMMGRWLCQAGSELLGEADALIPVPSLAPIMGAALQPVGHARCHGIKSNCVPVLSGALKRIKPTTQQVGLS